MELVSRVVLQNIALSVFGLGVPGTSKHGSDAKVRVVEPLDNVDSILKCVPEPTSECCPYSFVSF